MQAIFEELLESASNSSEVKAGVVNDSEVCTELADMADYSAITLKSSRSVRNGHMGFVVKLANLVLKRAEIDHLDDMCPDQLSGTEWRLFTNGELVMSNKNNNKSLGGHTRTVQRDEDSDEANTFDVNMEIIMSRFNTYS